MTSSLPEVVVPVISGSRDSAEGVRVQFEPYDDNLGVVVDGVFVGSLYFRRDQASGQLAIGWGAHDEDQGGWMWAHEHTNRTRDNELPVVNNSITYFIKGE